MANHLPTLIRPWLDEFVASDWLCFRSHGLAAIRFLKSIRLRPEILRAALRFWDRDIHVFRFGDNELCPTVEEFQAYLQGSTSSVIIVPSFRQSMSKLLKTCLNISRGAAESLLTGGEINIIRLMEWYGPDGDPTDTVLQARRRFAISVGVLAAYFLVSPYGRPDPSLVDVALQTSVRKNVVPMVLAETLIGLDLVAAGQTNTFGGSPLLLQLWLCDKLGLITAPGANWPRLPGRMHQRGLLYPDMSEEEWHTFMQEMSPREIIWRHEALDIPDMALHSAGFERMVIAGLTSFTFYIPGRILRQLGMSQGFHRAGIEDFQIPAFTAQHVVGYERNWGLRELGGVEGNFSTRLKHRYVAWLREGVARRQNTD